jgi:hypothetical protein
MTQECGRKKTPAIVLGALLRLSNIGPPSPFADFAATHEG